MANVEFHDLKRIMEEEGVEIDEQELRRVFRRIDHPGGCKHCGANVSLVKDDPKVKGGLVLVCCKRKV